MPRPNWTWTAVAAAALVGAAGAMLTAGASPARSDDGDEEHVPPSDFDLATQALDDWDDDDARESAIAAYVGAESRDAAFAPFEDPSYLDTH